MILVISACGNQPDSSDVENDTMDQQGHQEEGRPTTTKTAEAEEVEVKLYTVGEDMKTMTFEPSRIEVPARATIHLVLMNNAKSEAMIHNAVVIFPGKQMEVVEAALKAGPEKEYIPETKEIIAHTSLAKPGETVKVTFQAPEKEGTYQYICTYPGHTRMKGVLIVRD